MNITFSEPLESGGNLTHNLNLQDLVVFTINENIFTTNGTQSNMFCTTLLPDNTQLFAILVVAEDKENAHLVPIAEYVRKKNIMDLHLLAQGGTLPEGTNDYLGTKECIIKEVSSEELLVITVWQTTKFATLPIFSNEEELNEQYATINTRLENKLKEEFKRLGKYQLDDEEHVPLVRPNWNWQQDSYDDEDLYNKQNFVMYL
ncbi:MAG: hypothetical protein ATN35_01070 [Epulopiscium sp. Nele67-Bin004]|nr:MAG: hypothetical protein ATN35_01070 [Epulopiscium sp. Nele67-Bin004]